MLVNNSYWQDNLQRVTDNKSLAQDFCEGSKGWHQGVLLSLVGLWDFQCGWKVPAVQAGSSVESCRFNNSGLRVRAFCPSGNSFKASRGGSSSHAGWWSLFWRKQVWRLCSNYGVNTLLCLWWESLLQGSREERSAEIWTVGEKSFPATYCLGGIKHTMILVGHVTKTHRDMALKRTVIFCCRDAEQNKMERTACKVDASVCMEETVSNQVCTNGCLHSW